MTKILIPPVTFTYSLESEAQRVLYILVRLNSQEYLNRGFFFLPKIPTHTTPSGKARVILLPSCQYPKIDPSLPATTPMTGPKHLVEELKALISSHYEPRILSKFITKIKNEWDLIEKDFFTRLFTILPQYGNTIKSINIIPTNFGTSCQFSLIEGDNRDLTIYLRSDQGVTELAEAIISSLVRHNLQYQYEYSWEEVESVVDFILRDTYLAELFPRTPNGTIKTLRGQQLGRLQHISHTYLESLNLIPQYPWTMKDDHITYKDSPVSLNNEKHKILLEVMLAKAGQTVSFDELAASLWGDDRDYSLYALTKEISRLRQTLKQQYITSSIQAHRKVGYSLK